MIKKIFWDNFRQVLDIFLASLKFDILICLPFCQLDVNDNHHILIATASIDLIIS